MERRSSLLEQIKDVRRTRAVQRASRKRHGSSGQGLATVAVVGYTNAVRGLIFLVLFVLFVLHKGPKYFTACDRGNPHWSVPFLIVISTVILGKIFDLIEYSLIVNYLVI